MVGVVITGKVRGSAYILIFRQKKKLLFNQPDAAYHSRGLLVNRNTFKGRRISIKFCTSGLQSCCDIEKKIKI